MANEKIRVVFFKKEEILKEIPLESMTKEFYQENSEYLYCPNQNCNANIEYCEGKRHKYFRTAKSKVVGESIVERHIDNCPYALEHSMKSAPKTIYDPSIGYLVSEKHIENVLKRANWNHTISKSGNPKTSSGDKNQNKPPITVKTSETATKGRAVLGVNDEQNSSKATREPNIYGRNINTITAGDYNTVKSVTGYLKEFSYNDNSITIELEMLNNARGRIYFSESFKVNYPTEFNDMNLYKKYFEKMIEKGNQVFIVCIGEIKKDHFDISVHIRNYTHFTIDGMKHNELMRQFHSLVR